MIYGERTSRTAYYVCGDGAQKMKRVPFMSGGFNEAWLQGLIEETPSILPTGEIGAEYAPLLCIGREVPVGSGDTKGYIDNLYITPAGHLVVVETKLWRNQESRRTVVAQIIDYAKELRRWDAEMLDAVAGDYFYQKYGQKFRVIDAMAREGLLSFSDEADFTDAVNDRLAAASFLLLIVGDGIRSNVLELAEFLNENTALSFNLELVEIEIYQHDDGVVVVPNLLMKTSVVERRIQSSASGLYILPPSGTSMVEHITYKSKPILPRREFIETFASRGGYDPDRVTEFLCDMDSVDGISISITPTELHIDCNLGENRRATLLYIGISGTREASVYMRPDRLIRSLEAAGFLSDNCKEFLDFFREYIDRAKCKAAPYEYGADRFYYADVDKLLGSSSKFAGAAERLMLNISD